MFFPTTECCMEGLKLSCRRSDEADGKAWVVIGKRIGDDQDRLYRPESRAQLLEPRHAFAEIADGLVIGSPAQRYQTPEPQR